MSSFETQAFALGRDWLPKLVDQLTSIRARRKAEIDAIADVFGDPTELAKFYVEPDCQQFNPAESLDEEDSSVIRQPVFERLEQFCAASPARARNQLLVLADAGMGKTSLLMMFALNNFTSFWPQAYQCVLLKLGPDTLERVEAIEGRRTKILLLDALDEDPVAWARITPRLRELLLATETFRKVIITCRTQFFTGGEDPFERRGVVQVEGFMVPVIYLSHLSDEQVLSYVSKRFPGDTDSQSRAIKAVNKMLSLRTRPMLLAHVDDFLDSAREGWSEFAVYRSLVKSWLMREEKRAAGRSADAPPTAEGLWKACSALACALHSRGARYITVEELEALARQHASDVGAIRLIDVKGRSLINKNSRGDFRFSHYSIQEFLVLHALLYGEQRQGTVSATTIVTDKMATLLLSRLMEVGPAGAEWAVARQLRLARVDWSNADLAGADLSGMVLTGTKLDRSVMKGCVLGRTKLDDSSATAANLSDADCRGLIATGATLTGAEASRTNFADANLERAVLTAATMTDCVLAGVQGRFMKCASATLERVSATGATFEGANFEGANLNNVTFVDVRASHASFRRASLQRADLRNADLRGADFSEADLSDADLRGANCRDASFQAAALVRADFRGAILEGASMVGARRSGLLRDHE